MTLQTCSIRLNGRPKEIRNLVPIIEICGQVEFVADAIFFDISWTVVSSEFAFFDIEESRYKVF